MENEADWERARDLFLDLADEPADRREAALADLARTEPALAERVRELLRSDPGAPGPTTRRFGPYEVVRAVGRGGMGEVFVARRADGEYEREVAIKLLRTGRADTELVRRFLRERQTLARLDHEYIARLLDGGTTPEGEPYLVLEYVDGEHADVYAARLDLRARLELFTRICSAVQHAHERGFVHRDLKPGNVLVRADGTPRLLDFGIARPERDADPGGPLTRTGHRLFTPEYASPEQVRGEVATAQSDVFALGVLLYVFLSGELPWRSQSDLRALEREICEVDPPPPSRRMRGTGRRRLAGDLDAVVLQCLAKRPRRRYASVADLREDVERHLAGLPIRARRTGTLERTLRFARRRPVVPVAIALTAALAVVAWRAGDSAEVARRRREELVRAVDGRVEAARDRWRDGETDAADEELAAALEALRELPGEWALQAEVLAQQAVFANLRGRWAASLELTAGAEEALARVATPDPQTIATVRNTRTYALQKTSPGEASRAAAEAAYAFAVEHLSPGDVLRVDAYLGLRDERLRAGDAQGARDVLAAAVQECREAEPRGETLARLLNDAAVSAAEAGQLDEAAVSYREALDILLWLYGERNPSVAKVRLNLGTMLYRAGRGAEAREELERSLAAFRALDLEQLAGSALHFMARADNDAGRLAEAEEEVREAIAIRTRLTPGLHLDRSRCLLGIVLAKAGRPNEARPLLEELLAAPAQGAFLPEVEAEARRLLAELRAQDGDD